MNFFIYIEPLSPYLVSIRKAVLEGNDIFTIDLRFPLKWEYSKYIGIDQHPNLSPIGMRFKVQTEDKEAGNRVITFFSAFLEFDINQLFEKVIYVIDKNIEHEKKMELLNKKIQELKVQFDQLSLEQLEGLKFQSSDIMTQMDKVG